MLSNKLLGRWNSFPLTHYTDPLPFKCTKSSLLLTGPHHMYGNRLAFARMSTGLLSERLSFSRCRSALVTTNYYAGQCVNRTQGLVYQKLPNEPRVFQGYSRLIGQRTLQPGCDQGRQSLRCGWSTRSRSMSLMSSVVDATPSRVQPYLRLIRLDKPTGTWLVYWPCAWGIALAADPGHLPSFYMLGLCGLAAVVVRGAACTINDMWDRDFDKAVGRTCTRPIASGAISRSQALVFLGCQLSLALGILLNLNPYSVVLGCLAVVPMALYPLAKRFTNWPQIFLGVTTNFSALIGYSAVHGSCDWSIILPLYVSCIAWTVIYDTIYGHQDKKDDEALGLGSTSILMAENTKYWLTGFGAAMVSGLVLVGAMAEQTVTYYLAVALTAAHVGNQVWTVDIHNPQDCWTKFRSNLRLGAIVFAGIVVGTLAKVSPKASDTSSESDEDKNEDLRITAEEILKRQLVV